MRDSKYTGLLAAVAMLAATGADALRQRKSGNGYRPQPERYDSALAREIADHNAAVEAKRRAKKAAKARR